MLLATYTGRPGGTFRKEGCLRFLHGSFLVMNFYKFEFTLFFLLLIYTARVKPSEEISESRNLIIDEDTREQIVNEEEVECPSINGKDCTITNNVGQENTEANDVGSCEDKSCDEGELGMLEDEEEEPKHTLMQESHCTEDHCHKPTPVDEKGSQGDSLEANEKEQYDEVSVKQDEVQDSQEPSEPSCVKKEEEKSCEGTEATVAATQGNENAEQSQEVDGVDPEQENVPLREILLKLKPEGLTDDEDDQASDYSATEANIGDVEIEEEALVSSGSAEKQETDSDANATKTNGHNSNNNSGSKKAVCQYMNNTEPILNVEIINATNLLRVLQNDPEITGRTTAGTCHLVYFFSPYCPFSVVGSPYVNALARSLPNIPVYGMDSIEYHSVNARYGVMGTPTLLLFHNGNSVGRYNASEYSVSQLMSFVRHFTDQEITNINVTSYDFRATLPAQLAEARPYTLWAAWVFLLSCGWWLFLTSEICARLTEAILNNWREAEAQNDHQD